jgi:hypothetical protein
MTGAIILLVTLSLMVYPAYRMVLLTLEIRQLEKNIKRRDREVTERREAFEAATNELVAELIRELDRAERPDTRLS